MAKKTTSLRSIRTSAKSKKLVWIFLIVTLLLTAAIAYFGLIKTDITVTRSQFPVRATFVVRVSQEAGELNVPGSFEIKTVSAECEGKSTGTVSSVPGKSSGTIKVVNNWNDDQPLQATTRFRSPDGQIFRSLERIDVPAGGEATVKVTADLEGKQGDLGPTHFTIPGLWAGLQESIYGVSDEKFTGGELSVAVVTEEAIELAKEQCEEKTKTNAATAFSNNVPEGSKRILIEGDIVTSQSSIAAGEKNESETFSYVVKQRFYGIIIQQDQLSRILLDKLSLQLTSEEELASIDTAKMVTTLDRAPSSDAEIDVRISTTGQARLKKTAERISPEHFTEKTGAEIKDIAEKEIGIETITVHIRPFWEKKTPKRLEQIHFIVR